MSCGPSKLENLTVVLQCRVPPTSVAGRFSLDSVFRNETEGSSRRNLTTRIYMHLCAAFERIPGPLPLLFTIPLKRLCVRGVSDDCPCETKPLRSTSRICPRKRGRMPLPADRSCEHKHPVTQL
jgi:hypothetical protein